MPRRLGNPRAVLDELGVDYYVLQDEAVMLCPWHEDRRAGNFSLNLETGQCHCFSCGEGGGLVSLVQQLKRIDRREATKLVVRSSALGGRTRPQEEFSPRAENDTTKIMNEAKLALFTDPPERELRKRLISLDAARECGILWDAGRKSWILPIRDPYSGKLWGWQSKGRTGVRNYPGESRRGAQDGVDKSRALFGLELAKHSPAPRRLILVESPLDVARLLTAGRRGGVSSFGVHVSEAQLDLIREFADELVLALDNDSKGELATRRICHGYRDSKGRWHPPWGWRHHVRVYNYGRSKLKDPGEQPDREIWFGLDNTISAVRWRPAC